MKIVTPISSIFKTYENYEKVSKSSDYFELRHFNYEFVDKKKVLFLHSDLQVNHLFFKNDFDNLKKILIKYNRIKYISFHLASNYKKPRINKFNIFIPGTGQLNREKMMKNTLINFKKLKRMFPNICFSVENNNFFNTGAYKFVTDPEFVSEVVNNSEIDFLFDISHAIISSHNLNISFDDYYQKLPTKKIKQIHLSRSILKNNIYLDLHYLPIINRKLIKIINEIKPKFVTTEYYKNLNNLININNKIKNIYEKK